MRTTVDQRIVMLLCSYHDALHAWDDRASGGGAKLMPSMWREGSYRELERQLRRMRDSRTGSRRLWWHVSARYLWTQTQVRNVHLRRTSKGPVPVPPAHTEIEAILETTGKSARVKLATWDPQVDMVLVTQGVSWLANNMYGGDHSQVVVPHEIWTKGLPPSAPSARLPGANGTSVSPPREATPWQDDTTSTQDSGRRPVGSSCNATGIPADGAAGSPPKQTT